MPNPIGRCPKLCQDWTPGTNKSFGPNTLQDRHVSFAGTKTKFAFRGKSGKVCQLSISDRRIARIIKSCQDLLVQHLFQYETEAGDVRSVTSDIINAYLREIAGAAVSAKDFRTWAGTILAAKALSEFESFDSAAAAKRNVRHAIETVAAKLGNTPTVCRKC